MLKNIQIINYRSCKNLSLSDINRLLILVGRNGAGKSNVMKSIDWAAKTISNDPIINSGSNLAFTTHGEIILDFELGDYSFKYHLKRERVASKKKLETDYFESLAKKEGETFVQIITRNNEEIKLQNGQVLNISTNISCIPALQSLLPVDNELRVLLDKISEFAKSINYCPLIPDSSDALEETTVFDLLVRRADYNDWLSGKSSKISSTQVLIYKILNMYLVDTDRFKELLSLIGPDGLGLISNIEITLIGPPLADSLTDEETDNTIYLIFFDPCGHKQGFRFFDLSYGTRRIIHFIVALLYDKASVALIEQIEDGIHDGLIDKLIPLVRDYSASAQYIIASHSSAVFDRVLPYEVAMIELVDGVTQARFLSAVELEAAKEYMQEDGPFSEFLDSLS